MTKVQAELDETKIILVRSILNSFIKYIAKYMYWQ